MTRRWTPGDDGTEPSLRPEPEWDAPSRNPSVWIFAAVVVAIILLTFGALELGEWLFRLGG